MNLLKKSLKDKGFVFFNLDTKNKKFVNNVNLEIKSYFKKKKIKLDEIDKIKLNDFIEHIYNIQKKINKSNIAKNFFLINKNIFKKIFNENYFAVQRYFYLRAILPKKFTKDLKPIDFHRESLNSKNNSLKKAYNLWIPLMNCKKSNAMKYYPQSHKLIQNKDFKIMHYDTKVKKLSKEHKLGYLYRERKIVFKKSIKSERLYEKNSIIIFSGELIHGNGQNLSKKIRFSIDLRFMKKKDMKNNDIQGSTGRKYFQIIKNL